MSQQQPQRSQQEPVKYGNVFPIQGELAHKPVPPGDAAMMQTAENTMLGHTQKGGAASTMQSAADRNERAGFVSHGDVSDITGNQGVSITETDLPGRRIISEAVGDQIVAQYGQAAPLHTMTQPSTFQQGTGTGPRESGITIGEALEAAVLTTGEKPVEWSDAAAIQAAEVRATGRTNIVPGCVAAATLNARTTNDEDKTKLVDVLSDATAKLPSDRSATRRDAEGVSSAEMRNDPYLTTHPAGVAASVAAAARLNQDND